MYKYYLTQRGIAPGCQPNDFTSWEETPNGELTNGKRCYGIINYRRELSPEELATYEITPHSEAVRLREYKPFNGWHKYCDETGNESYDDYAKPGDIVDEETFDYFLGILPPAMMKRGYLQVGEPYSAAKAEDGSWKKTWMTFAKKGDKYFYLGHCFIGEHKHRG